MDVRQVRAAALGTLAFAGLFFFEAGEGGFPGPAGAAEGEGPPITITADEMEYLGKREVVIFTGNAVAVRGEVTLSARKMEVTLSEGVESDENRVKMIVAEGDVNFRHVDPETGRERFATGERGEYLAAEERVDLTGNPRVWEGKNVVTGEKMTFFVEENRFVVQGKKGKPAGLMIYQEKKEEE